MVKPKESGQIESENVSIDELVSADHLLRVILNFIDFLFLIKKVRTYYSDDHGRPINPLILFKRMFIGYIYDIRSERQIEREVRTNIAFRRFLGLKSKDAVLHHSTIGRNRQHRFINTTLFQEIIDEIVFLAMNYKMVGECVLISDSTYFGRSEKKCCNSLG